jgi:hypothetical protein
VDEQSGDGWTNEFNDDNHDDDPTGLRCPSASHARRTDPRDDTYRRFGSPVTIERSRRIMRSGISCGSTDLDPTEGWTETGLLFLCFQANIEDQFIFIQHTWSNNQDFLEGVGTDPIVGQVLPGENPVAQVWPRDWGRPHSQTDSTFGGVVRNARRRVLLHPEPIDAAQPRRPRMRRSPVSRRTWFYSERTARLGRGAPVG